MPLTKVSGSVFESADNNLGKFNRWTILSKDGRDKNGKALLKCECECGTIKSVQRYDITSGKSKSCGCLQREVASVNSYIHGLGGLSGL